MKRVVVMWTVLAFGVLAFPRQLTLESALQKAVANNPSIQALRESVRARQENAVAQKRIKFGELLLNGGVSKMSDDNLIRPMTKDLLAGGFALMPFDDELTYWNLDYRVPLFTSGQVKAGERSAAAAFHAEDMRLRSAVWSVRYQVVSEYGNLDATIRQLMAWQDYLDALNSLKAHIELGVQNGKYAELDLLKVNYEVADAKLKIAGLQQKKQALTAALAALIGEKPGDGEGFELAPVDLEHVPMELPETNHLVTLAMEQRSDLKRAKALAEASGELVKLAKADRLPKVFLDARLNRVNGGNIDYNDQYWSATINVSIPVFDMGRRHRKVLQAKHGLEAARHQVDQAGLTVRREVVDAVAGVERALQDVASSQAARDLALEVARLEQLKYDNGRGDIDDLLRAKARAKLSETGLIQARMNHYVALENLKKVLEGEIK